MKDTLKVVLQPETAFAGFVILLIFSYVKIYQQLRLMKKEQPEVFKKIRYVYASPFHQFFAYFCVPEEDRSKFSDKVRSLARGCAFLYVLSVFIIILGLWMLFKGY